MLPKVAINSFLDSSDLAALTTQAVEMTDVATMPNWRVNVLIEAFFSGGNDIILF